MWSSSDELCRSWPGSRVVPWQTPELPSTPESPLQMSAEGQLQKWKKRMLTDRSWTSTLVFCHNQHFTMPAGCTVIYWICPLNYYIHKMNAKCKSFLGLETVQESTIDGTPMCADHLHSVVHFSGSSIRCCLVCSSSFFSQSYLARTSEILCCRCSKIFSLALKYTTSWGHNNNSWDICLWRTAMSKRTPVKWLCCSLFLPYCLWFASSVNVQHHQSHKP